MISNGFTCHITFEETPQIYKLFSLRLILFWKNIKHLFYPRNSFADCFYAFLLILLTFWSLKALEPWRRKTLLLKSAIKKKKSKLSLNLSHSLHVTSHGLVFMMHVFEIFWTVCVCVPVTGSLTHPFQCKHTLHWLISRA